MNLFSRILIGLGCVAMAACLASTAGADVIANWTFDGTGAAWLDDSSGNGHTLTVSGTGVTQGAGGVATFGGAGWLTTAASVDLTPYRRIRVSWSQNIPAAATGTHVSFGMNDTASGGFSSAAGNFSGGWPSNGGRWDSLTGPNSGQELVDQSPAGTMLPNVWEQFAVEYDLDAASGLNVVRVFKGETEVGVTEPARVDFTRPTAFLSNVFSIGASATGSLPFTGSMDNFMIESLPPVPEPNAMMLVVTGVAGLLAYAWRKRR